MPEVACTRTVERDQAAVWSYVSNMNNWAPYIMGYQTHEIVDDEHSIWTVKGEIGPLAKTVKFGVDITEWAEPERVRFVLRGITETFTGSGSFLITDTTGQVPPPPQVRRGLLARLLALFRRGRRQHAPSASETTAVSGAVQTTFSFDLTMQAGGMTGPVVNAMIQPLMRKAADELADILVQKVRDPATC